MKSILKKFEKNAIEMSKIYGGSEHYTGRRSVGDVGSGEEYQYLSDDGSVRTVVFAETGIIYDSGN